MLHVPEEVKAVLAPAQVIEMLATEVLEEPVLVKVREDSDEEVAQAKDFVEPAPRKSAATRAVPVNAI
jgi:hypothetical protein